MSAPLPDEQLTRKRPERKKPIRNAQIRVPFNLTEEEADRLDTDRGRLTRTAYIRERLFGGAK